MGQQEVYSLLKRYKNKWFSSKEVADKLKLSSGSVTVSLQKLKKQNLVYCKLSGTTKSTNKRKFYIYKVIK